MALTQLADSAAVAARLRRALTTDETAHVGGLLDEATVKALSHMGISETYFDDKPIPTTVSIVVSRMVARVFEQAAKAPGLVPGMQQAGTTTGPFSQQTTFVNGSANGGPWLTRSDRDDLDNAIGKNKVVAVDRVATTSVHAEYCAINFGALYCSCGVDIAGSVIY